MTSPASSGAPHEGQARLVEERLMTAVGAVATMETALAHTIAYTSERKAFGQRVIDFQNSRFIHRPILSLIRVRSDRVDQICIRNTS